MTQRTQAKYERLWGEMDHWLFRSGVPALVLTDPAQWLDCSLADYLDEISEDGAPLHEAEWMVAAMRARYPEYSGRSGLGLPRADRSLKAFSREHPPRSRHPMPHEVTAANAVQLLNRYGLSDALRLLLQESCYLRPGEASNLQVRDLLRPVTDEPGGMQFWSILIAPQERGQPTKTQCFDDTLFLDGPGWIGPMLGSLGEHRLPDHPLFVTPHKDFRMRWVEMQGELGLKDTCLYQVRHGGASHDLLSHRRDLLQIMARGRWSSTSSLKRYAKSGKVQKLLNDLEEETLAYAKWCAKHLEMIMRGEIDSVASPTAGGNFRQVHIPKFNKNGAAKRMLRRPGASSSAVMALQRVGASVSSTT